jgi:hypothetical protein
MLLHGRFKHGGRAEARPSKMTIQGGCSKMIEGKARAVMRNEAYSLYAAMTHDKRNAANDYFWTASLPTPFEYA